MKKLLLALTLLLAPSLGFAQCNGVFANNTVCGNATGSANTPRQTSPSAFQGSAGGTNGQTQYNSSGALGGYTPSGDVTVNPSTGVETIQSGVVSNSKLATAPATTTKCNATTGTAAVTDCQSAFLHSKDYGATGNGSTDDTTALQNWINACVSTLIPCFLDEGTYVTSTALSVTAGIEIKGAGRGISTIQPATTINGFNVSSVAPVFFHDFRIAYASAANGGTGAIQITAGVGVINSLSRFVNLWISDFATGINFIKADLFLIDNVYFFSAGTSAAGVLINNTNNGDDGDSTIINSTFSFLTASSNIGIAWQSAGGLRVINNKFITLAYGIQIALASGLATSDIIIQQNSIESFSTAGITAFRAGSTGSLFAVQITGNEFSTGVSGTTYGVLVSTDANGAWLTDLTIVGNIWRGPGAGTNFFVNINSLSKFVISANQLDGSGGGTNTGYLIGSAATKGLIDSGMVDVANITTFANSSTTTVLKDTNGVTTANLPSTAANGSQIFATDADPATACTHVGAQTGSTAFRQNGAWKCF